MERRSKLFNCLLTAVVGLSVAASSVALAETGKIPITTTSDEARTQFVQGRDLYEKLRGPESIPYFEKAIADDPDFAMAHLFLAQAQPTNKGFFAQLDKAEALVDKASDGEKNWILGVQAAAGGDAMKASKYFQKLVELYPNDERAHNQLGNFYFGQQDWQDAIAQYQDAIKIDPNFSQPYNQLGYAQRFLGNFTDAEAAFKKYIELIPGDPNPYDSYAELLMKMGEFQKSIDSYKKALAIDSHFVASYLGIATDLDYLGQPTEARQELDKLLNVARNDGERRAAHFAMAVSYADEGKLEDALVHIQAEYDMADKIDDASAKAGDLINMGRILLEEGKPEQAQAKYDDALKQIEDSDLPKDVKENADRNYLYNSARVSVDEGKLDDAESYTKEFMKAAQEIKNNLLIKLAHELLGMIAYEKKDYNTALAEFGQSNLQNPYNLYRVALTYEANGDRANAKKFCAKVVKFNALNNLNYAFIRNDAKQMLASME